jgi:protein-tyrosine-phosphatase
MFGGTAVEAYSAGPRPAAELDPRAVSFMGACGYDLSAHFPKGLGDIPREEFDVFVAVDGESADTAVQARRWLEWNIPLPDDCSADQFLEMGVLIETKVRELLESM